MLEPGGLKALYAALGPLIGPSGSPITFWPFWELIPGASLNGLLYGIAVGFADQYVST